MRQHKPNSNDNDAKVIRTDNYYYNKHEEERKVLQKRRGRLPVLLIVLALISICMIFYLKRKKEGVEPRTPPIIPTVDYGILIKTHADQASRRNVNALRNFEINLNRFLSEHSDKLTDAGTRASKEASGYGSCCAIVYYMAWDRVKGGDETQAFLDMLITPIIESPINALAKDVDMAVQDLERDLRQSTLLLAKDLAALGPPERRPPIQINVEDLGRVDIATALRDLGFNAGGIGVVLAFDITALCKTQIAKALWPKVTSIVGKLFGKQVTKLAASAAISQADGPFLPIADIIALGGVIWTGYDIHAGRKEFERELLVSLENILADAKSSFHGQAIGHANSLVKAYQALQDDIGTQTINDLSGRRE